MENTKLKMNLLQDVRSFNNWPVDNQTNDQEIGCDGQFHNADDDIREVIRS